MTASEPSVAAWLAAAVAGPAWVAVIVKVTLVAKILVAVTVLGPGVDPRVSWVLAVLVEALHGTEHTTRLAGGEKVSPGALLVQLTEPQFWLVGRQSIIRTTRAPGTMVLIGAL